MFFWNLHCGSQSFYAGTCPRTPHGACTADERQRYWKTRIFQMHLPKIIDERRASLQHPAYSKRFRDDFEMRLLRGCVFEINT